MAAKDFEAIVIGGGPAGSTCAARLAQRGRRVLLVERETFPRFHVGESLLPCSMPLFDELGVGKKLATQGFLPKHAAEFVTEDGSLTRRYPFAEGVIPGPSSAYEVERASFDQLLLEHASELGVLVRQGVKAERFDFDEHGARVVLENAAGSRETLTAEVVIDASGQSSLLARQLGVREMDPELKNFAVFSHYTGAARASGEREGDISIVLAPQGWWWVIPLQGDRTSVGLVAPTHSLNGARPDALFFESRLEGAPYLKQRFANASRVEPVRTASDYSYRALQLAGDRWLLVGDAAAFIDPVFSTGVYLGMREAFVAADAVDAALAKRRFRRRQFADYERFATKAIAVYRDFAKGFYTPEFVEVMMHPSDTLQLRQAVTSLLAGYGIGHFGVDWRIRIFWNIIRANKRWQLTPRLSGRREAAAAASVRSPEPTHRGS